MTCDECRDLMLEVARDRAAPPIERAVLAHTACCAACSRDLERERAVTAGLRAVALQHAGSTPSPNLEARLLDAFAAQHQEAEAGPAAGEVPAGRSPKAWLTLAAALALCAGGSAWWLARTQPVAPAVEIATVQPLPVVLPVQPAEAADLAPATRVASVPRHRVRRPAARPPIQAVGFIPIPSAAGLPEFESGQIVRLGIPVTALPNYGLEIPSGVESSIQADLLVGQDGQPRAIRLVNANSPDLHPRR
jgi:hypothetical protein